MKISCNDCRQKLGEMFENQNANGATAAAQPQATAEVQQHLAECPECRSELALLNRAREEMRAFPALAAPTNLRARIRQQLEAEPVEVTAPTRLAETTGQATALPVHAPTVPVASAKAPPTTFTQGDPFQAARASHTAANEWQVAQPSKTQEKLEGFRAFLRHPSNVAWMSCSVIILAYVVSLSMPKGAREATPVSPDSTLLSQYERRDNDEDDRGPQFVAPAATPPNLAARPGDKNPAPPLADPKLPEHMKPPSLLTPFDNTPLPAVKGVPAAPKGDVPAEAARTPLITKLPDNPGNLPASATPRPTSPAPPAPRPKTEAPGNNSTTFAMRPPAAESGGFDAAKRSSATAGATGPIGQSAPAAPARPEAAISAFMRRDDSPVLESETTRTQSAKALSVREINTRITPPRRVAFGQVSVNLPEGVRFSDGSRARVIWRGSAEANEPIDLSFTVQAMPGQQTVKITLQEVRNNDAQMVAHKSVQIGTER